MLNRRHINEKSAWQCNVRSYPRAFLGNRFLSYLDQDFLSFLQQVGDGWLMTFTPGNVSVAATTLWPALPLVTVVALWRSRDWRRRDFHSLSHYGFDSSRLIDDRDGFNLIFSCFRRRSICFRLRFAGGTAPSPTTSAGGELGVRVSIGDSSPGILILFSASAFVATRIRCSRGLRALFSCRVLLCGNRFLLAGFRRRRFDAAAFLLFACFVARRGFVG